MTTVETRMKEAFDELAVPDGLNVRTLERIEAMRRAEQEGVAGEGRSIQGGVEAAASAPAISVVRPPARRRGPSRPLALAFAACLILACAGIGFTSWWNRPVAYIAVDMNPSLELVVNGRDVVIAAEPVNDDGAMVLEGNDLVGKDCREALECLVQSEAFAGFVDETSYLEFGVVCDDEQRSLRLIEKCEAASAVATCETACATASEAERLAAQEAGMGVGRYRLALELTQQDSSLTLEDCAHMTMRELRDELGEDDMRGDGQAGGHGGGHGYQKGSQSQ